jgi:hypothetical protein
MPRGSNGSPPERGVGLYADRSGIHQTRSGHMSVPDPRLGPVQGMSMFCPRTLGPHCGRPEPHTGGPAPIPGVRLAHVEVWTNLEGPDYISRGPAFSHGGLSLLLMPWGISPSLDAWRLRTHPCGGVRHCCGPRVVARGWGKSWSGPTYSSSTTRLRDSRVGTASLYSSRGYPSFRVPTMAPGPTSGEDASLQVGPKLVPCLNMA